MAAIHRLTWPSSRPTTPAVWRSGVSDRLSGDDHRRRSHSNDTGQQYDATRPLSPYPTAYMCHALLLCTRLRRRCTRLLRMHDLCSSVARVRRTWVTARKIMRRVVFVCTFFGPSCPEDMWEPVTDFIIDARARAYPWYCGASARFRCNFVVWLRNVAFHSVRLLRANSNNLMA